MTVSVSAGVIFILWGAFLLARQRVPLIYGAPLVLAGLFLAKTALGTTLTDWAIHATGALAHELSAWLS